MKILLKLLVFFVFIISVHAQDVDKLIEKIYQQNVKYDSLMAELGNYSYKQKVEFTKFDGDGDIDEKSYREFEVLVQAPDIHERELIVARDFEDGEWIDVTEERRKRQEKSESKQFSLDEMVGPDERKKYDFTYMGREIINDIDTEHVKAQYLEEDEDKFNGDLWFDAAEYNIVKARLIPSDFPTGVEFMMMDFEMQKINGYWLPVSIHLDAEISFLFIFSGKIQSRITNFDYVIGEAQSP